MHSLSFEEEAHCRSLEMLVVALNIKPQCAPLQMQLLYSTEFWPISAFITGVVNVDGEQVHIW